ncbi:DUF4377 domain-containing protein [Kaistella faecalis]|uniref:DUF4377 domain-containing protein n=1 Tax=Kaistella faecalis TaxID=2852098 RepID=UPI001C471F50|nr:DUF4377 domain-containing protein [Chryseobacterium faecale]UFK97839.1 DUF4377 domain-containing protein [Chryseobacterium faecale]
MKKIIYLLSIFSLVALLTISCSRDEDTGNISTVTATVHDKYVDYAIPPDFEPIKAMKIKESNSQEWTKVVSIEGFDYEENFEYQLKLRKTYTANPPLDSYSHNSYQLLEILAKTPK